MVKCRDQSIDSFADRWPRMMKIVRGDKVEKNDTKPPEKSSVEKCIFSRNADTQNHSSHLTFDFPEEDHEPLESPSESLGESLGEQRNKNNDTSQDEQSSHGSSHGSSHRSSSHDRIQRVGTTSKVDSEEIICSDPGPKDEIEKEHIYNTTNNYVGVLQSLCEALTRCKSEIERNRHAVIALQQQQKTLEDKTDRVLAEVKKHAKKSLADHRSEKRSSHKTPQRGKQHQTKQYRKPPPHGTRLGSKVEVRQQNESSDSVELRREKNVLKNHGKSSGIKNHQESNRLKHETFSDPLEQIPISTYNEEDIYQTILKEYHVESNVSRTKAIPKKYDVRKSKGSEQKLEPMNEQTRLKKAVTSFEQMKEMMYWREKDRKSYVPSLKTQNNNFAKIKAKESKRMHKRFKSLANARADARRFAQGAHFLDDFVNE